MVSQLSRAAASSGRQSRVKQGTESTTFSMVECIPSAIERTALKPEQEGDFPLRLENPANLESRKA